MRFVSSALLVALALGSAALGSTITYIATGTSSGGNTENASAVFTTGAGMLTITLNDLLSNPSDVGQNLSDIIFNLSNGANTGTLSSSSGTELTVHSNGSFTVGSSVSTGWAVSSMGTAILLSVVGTPEAPAHTIIGPPGNTGTYSNANNSIAGNGPHNPFLESGATFTISIPTVTASTNVTAAIFSFGTVAGNNLTGVATGTTVPEPTTMLLMGLGLLAIGMVRYRRA